MGEICGPCLVCCFAGRSNRCGREGLWSQRCLNLNSFPRLDTSVLISTLETCRHPYRRNLGNTVMTVCLSLLIMPLLYNYLWYPNLRQQALQFSEDIVDHAYFPSIAVFQRMDWSSQATLDDISAEPNCFLGWYEPNAADCNTSEPGTLPCSCNGSWSEDIRDFVWQNASYRYLNMQATSAMLCNIPTTLMILQAFYWFNSTQEFVDSSWKLSPSLWVAIYDPTLTLQEALENGYTRMVLINANGMTAINLGLNYRQAFGSAPAYDYELSISTIPATSIVCDLGSTTQAATGPCHISLFLQIPSFTRQTSLLSYEMGWTQDVVSNAGAYFSFIQLISWIFSGIAFQT
ncbi:hypothetical protein OIDMADRAFT_133314 [Oidiodendron maius Zn]|uniref:Uncharacterized protein n=1 Tax=Oidiodendron maius (strain Zn) TaxID=913774 RepID=A0A0C3D189_OIDMZ|nr:hypothetical protein OIDMADRAFT_133314 [Oidiodendron maius Zn]